MLRVGFHQSHRPAQTRWQRIREELEWPNPAGIAVTLAGAGVVIVAASLLGGPVISGTAPATASGPRTGTTPAVATAPAPPLSRPATAGAVSSDTSAPPSSVSASPAPTATAAPALSVFGAAPDSPIQLLFPPPQAGVTAADALASTSNPASTLVLVNKRNPLSPRDYAPPDLVAPAVPSASAEPMYLRKVAAEATEKMFAAAAADGVRLTVMSSYRSYETQVSLYNSYVVQNGQAEADTASARPGYSEHQTGFAMDIGDAASNPACDFVPCFKDSAGAKWVALHAQDYGFVVRYQLGFDAITGYFAEPWHLRYLGVDVAKDLTKRGFHSYEQYLGVPAAPGY